MCMNSDFINLSNTVSELAKAHKELNPNGYDLDFERPDRGDFATDELFLLAMVDFYRAASNN